MTTKTGKRIQYRPAPAGYENATWSHVCPEAVTRTEEAFREKRLPLFIHGDTGTGKTCLAALVYRAFVNQPLWHRSDDLLLSLTTGRGRDVALTVEGTGRHGERVRKRVSFDEYLSRYRRSPLVVLDDVGVREPTDAMQQVLFDLLELRKDRPLVLTSNVSPETLADLYDDRIVSRVLAGTVLELSGSDRREGLGRRYRA